jgi:hypothetical protein
MRWRPLSSATLGARRAPGSIEAVREGREPIEVNAATVQQQQQLHQRPHQSARPSNPLKSVPTEELLELRRRIVWYHPGSDGHEKGWDALVARGDWDEHN